MDRARLVEADRGGHGLTLAIDGMGQRQGRPGRGVAVSEIVMQPRRRVIAGRIDAATALACIGIDACPGPPRPLPVISRSDRTEDALLRPALRGLAARRIVTAEAGT